MSKSLLEITDLGNSKKAYGDLSKGIAMGDLILLPNEIVKAATLRLNALFEDHIIQPMFLFSSTAGAVDYCARKAINNYGSFQRAGNVPLLLRRRRVRKLQGIKDLLEGLDFEFLSRFKKIGV